MSFEKEFTTLRELGPGTFTLKGATLIVEILEPEEIKTKSGLIMAQTADHAKGHSVAAHKVDVGRVLMSGYGYWVEGEAGGAGRFEELECQPGAIVLLPQYSTQLMSHFPGIQRPTGNKLAMIKMDQILAYYPSQEAYELAKAKLNA
jgi:co-chaperonin GroES (HSP10)